MPDAFTITDKIIELCEHPENTLSFLIVVLLVVGTIVALAEYKSKLWTYMTNRRNKWYVTSACFAAAVLIGCYKKHWISGTWMWITAALWLVFAMMTFLDLRPLNLHTCRSPILRCYRRYLTEGTAYSHIGFFEKERKLLVYGLFSSTDRIEYYFLKHSYRIAVGNYEGAYKTLQLIKETMLYEAEQTVVQLRKAYCLAMMGNMNAALQLLGKYEENQSTNPMVWIAYSYIFENAGDMDRAYQAASKAVALADTSDLMEWEKGEVYNDFGRAAIIHGNDEEALRYMRLAWEKVKDTKDNRLIHVIGGNRVLRMAVSGERREACDAALEEYRKRIIHPDAPSNRIEYMNVLLQYYRQVGDEDKLYAAIKKGYRGVAPKLKTPQQVVFKASVFRILMNGHFERKWFDKEIDKRFEAYKDAKLMDRLFAFREFMGIFTQEEFRAVTNRDPYKTLKSTILKYYQEDAIREIDDAIVSIEGYNVYQYKELMQHKLAILKHIEGKEHIEKSKEIYLQLAQSLDDAGLHIDAANIRIILMDECTSPYNILIATPLIPEWLYFSDFMDILPPSPDPIPMADGIHLSYFRVNMPRYAVRPLKSDVIIDNIDEVIREVKGWASHPAKCEYCVMLARLLMCLSRKDEAKVLFQIYKRSKIAERQYASWMIEIINDLEASLGDVEQAVNQ